MKIKFLFAAVAVAVSTTSCETASVVSAIKKNADVRIAQANVKVDVVNPAAKINVNPTRFSEEFVYSGTELAKFYRYGVTDDINEKLKTDAASKFLRKHNGDVLVAPLFDAEPTFFEGFINSYKITIHSYVGNFVDWDKNGLEEAAEENGDTTGESSVSVFTIQ